MCVRRNIPPTISGSKLSKNRLTLPVFITFDSPPLANVVNLRGGTG
jgi:hypothetical protein